MDEALLAKVRDLATALESSASRDVAARTVGGLAIWMMVDTISSWVLDAGGMLQRNKLISKHDESLVRQWVYEMKEIGFRLLDQQVQDSEPETGTSDA